MASSRWKRFAFFERQTLTIPPDILEDLIPSSSIITTADGGGGTLGTDAEVHLTVSTAALPLDTQPAQIDRARFQQLCNSINNRSSSAPESSSVLPDADSSSAAVVGLMWSSLTACTSPEMAHPSSSTTTSSSILFLFLLRQLW